MANRGNHANHTVPLHHFHVPTDLGLFTRTSRARDGQRGHQRYSVFIDPDSPTSENVLQAIVTGSPPPSEDFVDVLSYEWTVNGEVRGHNEHTLLGAKYFERGDKIEVTVSDFPNGQTAIQSDPVWVVQRTTHTSQSFSTGSIDAAHCSLNTETTIEMPNYSMLSFDDSMTIEMWLKYHGNNNGIPQLLVGYWNDKEIGFGLKSDLTVYLTCLRMTRTSTSDSSLPVETDTGTTLPWCINIRLGNCTSMASRC